MVDTTDEAPAPRPDNGTEEPQRAQTLEEGVPRTRQMPDALSAFLGHVEAAAAAIDKYPGHALGRVLFGCQELVENVGRPDLAPAVHAMANALIDQWDGRQPEMFRPYAGPGSKGPPFEERGIIIDALMILDRFTLPPVKLPRGETAKKLAGALKDAGIDFTADQLITARRDANSSQPHWAKGRFNGRHLVVDKATKAEAIALRDDVIRQFRAAAIQSLRRPKLK